MAQLAVTISSSWTTTACCIFMVVYNCQTNCVQRFAKHISQHHYNRVSRHEKHAFDKAQAGVTMMKRLAAALQNTAQSLCKQLWVQGSAVLCFIASLAAIFHPATCAYGVKAVAAAYAELGWMFWLLLLDTTCAAVACIPCCRWLFRTIRGALGRIWSASSISFSYGAQPTVSSFQERVNSHFSKATALVRHTLSSALRQLKALLWLLTVCPLTLVLEVGFSLCGCCLCPPIVIFPVCVASV